MDNVGMELVIQKETSPDIISIRPFSVLVFRVPENYQSKSSCRQIFFFFLSSFYTVSNCRDLPEILFLLPLSSLFIRSFHCQFSFTSSILFPYLKFSFLSLYSVMLRCSRTIIKHVITLYNWLKFLEYDQLLQNTFLIFYKHYLVGLLKIFSYTKI